MNYMIFGTLYRSKVGLSRQKLREFVLGPRLNNFRRLSDGKGGILRQVPVQSTRSMFKYLSGIPPRKGKLDPAQTER